MKKLLLTTVWLTIVGIFCNTALAQSYSGGSGTKDYPYLISTKADLKFLSENTSEWSKHFLQTADIVFSTADFQSGGNFYNSGLGFSPIGNLTTKFTGSYRGGGYAIENLFINRPTQNFIGLFGYANPGSSVVRLGLKNINFTGKDYVGGIVGYTDDCYFYNSYTTGSVTGNQYVGGIVGFINLNTMEKSYTTCSVSGKSYVGGITGENYASLYNCFATGSVTGTGTAEYIGGLIGFNDQPIQNCYSTGAVTGSLSVGGLVGYDLSSGAIYDCHWDTQTSGQANSSGGTGNTTAEMKTLGTFVNWDFTDVWQLPGSSYPVLKWQVTSCTPTSSTINVNTYEYFYTLNNISYDQSGTYVQVLPNAKDCDSTITLNITFSAYPFSGGSGTEQDPYLVSNTTDLRFISERSENWGYHYRQIADIVCNASEFQSGGQFYNFGNGFIPIGTPSARFTGTYKGDNHKIENLIIGRQLYNTIAFFGVTHTTCTIENLELKNIDVTGGNSTAALVAINYGTITNCSASGSVDGATETGGLVGSNSGSISKSFSSVAVSGYYYVGGLVAYNASASATISNCYATGTLYANSYIGGLLGDLYAGTVENCYSTGSITGVNSIGGLIGINEFGTETGCYWDTEASARNTSDGGTGKTTSEMQTQSTFSGWDFSTIWSIASGYPVLRPAVITSTEKSVQTSEFSLFPNPANSILNFNVNTEYEISNVYGATVIKGKGDHADVSNLPTGIYNINIKGQIVKFVKE